MSNDEHRIPLIEERVRVDRKLVDSGVVRISTSVRERREVISAGLMHEEVDIERIPREQKVDRVPELRTEGDVLIIPVVEERVVVTKQLVLIEELRVHRRIVHEKATIPVDLRSTEVHVQRDGASGDAAVTRNDDVEAQ